MRNNYFPKNPHPRTVALYDKAEEVMDKYLEHIKVQPDLITVWDDMATIETQCLEDKKDPNEQTPMVYMMFNSVLVLISESDIHVAPNLLGNPAMLCYESAVLARECGAKTTECVCIDPADGNMVQGEEESWAMYNDCHRRIAQDLVNTIIEENKNKPSEIIDNQQLIV